MQRPVQFYLFAAVLLFTATAIASTARAELTQADKAEMHAFTACLDETGGEEACIEKLGRYAWYPRDDATCQAVGAHVERVIEVSGDPVWRDLFRNERCARLGMAYSASALLERKPDAQAPRPFDCRKERNINRCYEIYGRHEWTPENHKSACEYYANLPIQYPDSLQAEWWDYWFKNERCHRFGREYFDAAAGIQRSAADTPAQ